MMVACGLLAEAQTYAESQAGLRIADERYLFLDTKVQERCGTETDQLSLYVRAR